MPDTTKTGNMMNKAIALRETKQDIISGTPEQSLDMVLSHSSPATLIQSFAEEDFYFLIHHIGVEDAVSVLSLAASDQWGYILDLEVWREDRLDVASMTKWLQTLLLADKQRTVRWLLTERLEFTELYLLKNICKYDKF